MPTSMQRPSPTAPPSSVTAEDHRQSSYSGCLVTCTFLDEGLTDPADVRHYLVDHGIVLQGK